MSWYFGWRSQPDYAGFTRFDRLSDVAMGIIITAFTLPLIYCVSGVVRNG